MISRASKCFLLALRVQHRQRLLILVAVDGEREVGVPRRADVLHDHVDVDVRRGDRPEDRVGDARPVLDAHHRDLRLVAIERDAGNDRLFHVVVFLVSDQRSVRRRIGILERRQHAQPHLVLAGELDRTDLQHLRALARELEHFLERDPVEPPRLRDDARIGRVDAVDVGVDLALVGLERGGERDARRVGAAAPERRDVAVLVDALKSRDDDDRAVGEVVRGCAARRFRGCAPWYARCRSGCAPARRCSCAP